jgi:formate dehydrogenase major subunit
LKRCTVPPGHLILQTLRSHDQFNTTIYGFSDRYRGIEGGRRVVFVNPQDIEELGFHDGEIVDLVTHWEGDDHYAEARLSGSWPTRRHAARPRRITPRPTRWFRWTQRHSKQHVHSKSVIIGWSGPKAPASKSTGDQEPVGADDHHKKETLPLV